MVRIFRCTEEQKRQFAGSISDEAALPVFKPEAKSVLEKKIGELQGDLKKLESEIKGKLLMINAVSQDPLSRHAGRYWLMLHEGRTLLSIESCLMRLQRLLALSESEPSHTSYITDDQIREARSKSIEQVVGQAVQLKRTGSTGKALCPFHEEKTPSFVIFPKSNSWKCFGCGAGGDTIQFLRLFHGLSFRDSISVLLGGIT